VLDKLKRFEGIHLAFDFADGDLVLIGIAMQFSETDSINHQFFNGKLFHPAGILSVRLDGYQDL